MKGSHSETPRKEPNISDLAESAVTEAATRNGRQCADVAVTFAPLPWSEDQLAMMLERLALGLVSSYPGGPAAFERVMPVAIPAARAAFLRRVEQLGQLGAGHTGQA